MEASHSRVRGEPVKAPAAVSVVSLRVRAFLQRTKSPTLLAIIAMLCAYGSAATGSVYTSGLNVPVGLLWLGSTETASGIQHGHVWAADAGGFCRIDDDGNGNATLTTTCAPALPGAMTGQPDWDPTTNTVYLPTAAGIARYTFNPSLAD